MQLVASTLASRCHWSHAIISKYRLCPDWDYKAHTTWMLVLPFDPQEQMDCDGRINVYIVAIHNKLNVCTCSSAFVKQNAVAYITYLHRIHEMAHKTQTPAQNSSNISKYVNSLLTIQLSMMAARIMVYWIIWTVADGEHEEIWICINVLSCQIVCKCHMRSEDQMSY